MTQRMLGPGVGGLAAGLALGPGVVAQAVSRTAARKAGRAAGARESIDIGRSIAPAIRLAAPSTTVHGADA